jgi:hypothetical protein
MKFNPQQDRAFVKERRVTLEALRQHVLDVWGKDDGIEWIEPYCMPEADHETQTLRLHPIKSEAAYAVALHEIGHLRQGLCEDELLNERRAWDWARDNALIWTPTMERAAEYCMRSYEAEGDEAYLKDYYYQEIMTCVVGLLGDLPYGLEVCDALIRNAVELAELYEGNKTRAVLIRLIDKYSLDQ